MSVLYKHSLDSQTPQYSIFPGMQRPTNDLNKRLSQSNFNWDQIMENHYPKK